MLSEGGYSPTPEKMAPLLSAQPGENNRGDTTEEYIITAEVGGYKRTDNYIGTGFEEGSRTTYKHPDPGE